MPAAIIPLLVALLMPLLVRMLELAELVMEPVMLIDEDASVVLISVDVAVDMLVMVAEEAAEVTVLELLIVN